MKTNTFIKKTLAIVLTAALGAVSLTGCGKASADVKDEKLIRVGVCAGQHKAVYRLCKTRCL